MLKKLTYIAVVLYVFVLYGQNIFDFGSDVRVNFYFIGMSTVTSVFSFILFKLEKNVATSFYMFMCLGQLFNEVFYNGEFDYFELTLGLLGVVYIFLELKLKSWIFRK